jgi:hypothetical protein
METKFRNKIATNGIKTVKFLKECKDPWYKTVFKKGDSYKAIKWLPYPHFVTKFYDYTKVEALVGLLPNGNINTVLAENDDLKNVNDEVYVKARIIIRLADDSEIKRYYNTV